MTTVVVRGQASFMFVDREDKYGNYSIEVVNLDQESIDRLNAVGLGHRIKVDSEANVAKLQAEGKNATFKGSFIRARSSRPIPVVDKQGNVVTAIIGNGSKIQAILKKFSYDGFGGGTSAGAEKVLIEELVPYVSQNDTAAEAEEASDAGAAEFLS